MNTAEKIAATYLRLNGFLLLPHFTVFDGDSHNHIDLIGVRLQGSEERVNNSTPLPSDEHLFQCISKIAYRPSEINLCVAAEVKSNRRRDRPTEEHIKYAARFMGINSIPKILRLSFSNRGSRITLSEGSLLNIPLKHALGWILERFIYMDSQEHVLSKEGSWAWSEEFLADLLILKKLGFLKLPYKGKNSRKSHKKK